MSAVVPEARMGAVPEARMGAVPEARMGAVPEARMGAVPEARMGAVPVTGGALLLGSFAVALAKTGTSRGAVLGAAG